MIVCKSAAELEKMRAANQLVARVLDALRALVVPGATTGSILLSSCQFSLDHLFVAVRPPLSTFDRVWRLWRRNP